MDGSMAKLNTYISVFDGKLNIISSLQSLQITLELAVVKEDLLHHIGPLNKSKRLLKDNTRFNIICTSIDDLIWECDRLLYGMKNKCQRPNLFFI